MTRETERSVAVQDGVYHIAGGMSAEEYFDYYVDNSLFESANEYASLVEARYQEMTA